MKKPVKTTLKVLAWTLGVIIILVLALPLWVGPLVKGVANSVVPGKAKTEFNLGEFALNPYSGSLHVGDLTMGNPEKFSEKQSAALSNLSVKVSVPSVLTDKIRIEDVTVEDVFVYIGWDGGYKNFDYIAANFQGLTPKEAEEQAKAAKAEEEKRVAEKKPAPETPGKKVQIDRIVLKGIKVKIGKMPAIPVPTITLTDIGKDKPEGATLSDVWDAVIGAVNKSCGAIGEGLKSLGSGVVELGKDGAKLVGEGAAKAADAAKNAAGAAADAAKNVTSGAADAAKNAAGAAADAAKNVTSGAADAAKNAAGALKGLFGGKK